MSIALAVLGVLGGLFVGLRLLIRWMVMRDLDIRKLHSEIEIIEKRKEVERAKQDYYEARDRALKSDAEHPGKG